MMMTRMTVLPLQLVVPEARLHAAQAAAHLLADPAAVQAVPLEAQRAAAHRRVPPVAQVAVHQAKAPVVVHQAEALVEAHPVRVVPVEALPVEDPVAVHPVEVPKAAPPRVQVAPLSERAHHDDYNRIQMPSPASTVPIVSSKLRAFSSSLVSKGVPEIIRATSTYQPPSIHIAMKATKARSPQVKSG